MHILEKAFVQSDLRIAMEVATRIAKVDGVEKPPEGILKLSDETVAAIGKLGLSLEAVVRVFEQQIKQRVEGL